MNESVILLGDGRRELAADEKMGNISEKLKVGKTIEEVENEIEVGRHPVAMGLDENREIDFLRKTPPSLDERDTVLQPAWPDIRLHIEVVNAKLGGDLKDRLQVVHCFGKALAFGLKPLPLEKARHSADVIAVAVVAADTLEPGLGDHLYVLLEATLHAIGMAALHRPQRLKDKQLLHSEFPQFFF